MIGGPRHNGRKVEGGRGKKTHFLREQSTNNVFAGLWVKDMMGRKKRKPEHGTSAADWVTRSEWMN